MTAARPTLRTLLGQMVPSRFSFRSAQPLDFGERGTRVLILALERQDGTPVRGFLTGPDGPWSALPSVLYCHAHGNRHDIGASELITSRPALLPEAYAVALARQGQVALAIDLPCFGARATEPESLAAKRHLWRGTTLFGEMLSDLSGALDLLTQWPGIDGARIGAFGISMGATLAFWLAALDQRVRCVAHLCCFADLDELVRLDGHDLHGLYMTVPGLLGHWRTGEIAGLVAPRPQFAAMGACDPLTPPAAIARALADVRTAYTQAGAPSAFEALIEPVSGHVETPAMRQRVLQTFSEWL